MRPLRAPLLAAALLVVTACGGGGGSDGAGCEPAGPDLEITAEDIAFSTDCLAAPAGQEVTLALTNDDEGVPHNVSVHDGDEVLFQGEIFTGTQTMTYELGPFDAGEYTFMCDVHPTMRGAFVVR